MRDVIEYPALAWNGVTKWEQLLPLAMTGVD
jgi:hypothetical protein